MAAVPAGATENRPEAFGGTVKTMAPAYWDSRRRSTFRNEEEDLATYLRNEFGNGASIAWLETDLPRDHPTRPRRPNRADVGPPSRPTFLQRLLRRNPAGR